MDGAGNIYLSDNYSERIRKISTSGVITTIGGTGSAGFSGDGGPATDARLDGPSGLCVDAAGNVYFADDRYHRVRKIDTSGIITTVAGGGGSAADSIPATLAQFFGACAVATDVHNNLYIADGATYRVWKVDPSGFMTTVMGGGGSFLANGVPARNTSICSPISIAVDAVGNVYVGEACASHVVKIDTFGILTIMAGTDTSGYNGDGIAATSARLDAVIGLAVDDSGNIYLSDKQNARVRKVSSTGVITTVAGTGATGYSGDGGPATAATVNSLRGLAVGHNGDILFADLLNSRIRSIKYSTAAVSAINDKSKDIKVFPDPSNGDVTVDMPIINEDMTITVTDMLDRVIAVQHVRSERSITLHLDVPEGTYLLCLSGSGQKNVRKMSIVK